MVGGHGLDAFAQSTVGAHYNLAFAAIIILALIVVYMLYAGKKQGMISLSPGQTMQYTTTSFGGSEALTAAPAAASTARSQSSFAQLTQNNVAPPADFYKPGTTTMTPDATAYCVGAHNPASDANAWAWMAGTLNGPTAVVNGNGSSNGEPFTQSPGNANLMAVMNGY